MGNCQSPSPLANCIGFWAGIAMQFGSEYSTKLKGSLSTSRKSVTETRRLLEGVSKKLCKVPNCPKSFYANFMKEFGKKEISGIRMQNPKFSIMENKWKKRNFLERVGARKNFCAALRSFLLSVQPRAAEDVQKYIPGENI